MIKVRMGGTVLLGIDKENVRRLKNDEPIYIKGKQLGLKQDIILVYGDTITDVCKKFGIPMQH